MDFLGQYWVHALVQSFREDNFLCDEWWWVVFEDWFKGEEPVVDIGPFSDFGETLQWVGKDSIEILSDSCELFTFLHYRIWFINFFIFKPNQKIS
jgi:hypothetical protein